MSMLYSIELCTLRILHTTYSMGERIFNLNLKRISCKAKEKIEFRIESLKWEVYMCGVCIVCRTKQKVRLRKASIDSRWKCKVKHSNSKEIDFHVMWKSKYTALSVTFLYGWIEHMSCQI